MRNEVPGRLGVAAGRTQLLPALLPVDGQQLQAGGPAVGKFVQLHRVAVVDGAELALQEALRFLRRKAQVTHIQFEQLAFGAKSVERQRHRPARGHHQVQVGRRVVQQPLQRLVDARVAQVVQIVEHQHQVTRMGGDGAHQRDQGALDGLAVDAAPGEIGRRLRHGRGGLGQAGEQVVEQAGELVVFGRQGEPGDVEAQRQQRLAPGDQGGGLAAAGRALQHQAAPAARLHQPGQQRLARHDAAGAARRDHLGGDERLQRRGIGWESGGG